MPEWSPENIGEALISKRVDAQGMGNLLDVLFLGGGAQQDVEKAQGDSAPPSNAPKSQQLDETFEKMAAGEYVHPQYDPNIWAQTSKMSTRLARCIRSYARNTVGLGWEVEPLRPLTSMDVKAERMAEGPPKSDKKPGAAAADKDKVTKIGLNDGPMSLGEALQTDGAPEPRSQQPTPGKEEQAPTWDGWGSASPNGESAATDESLAEARLQEKKEVEWQTEALRDLFEHPNDHIPFTELMYLVKNDEETVGNGYLEIVRNAAGRIVQLHHVPATTVRRRSEMSGSWMPTPGSGMRATDSSNSESGRRRSCTSRSTIRPANTTALRATSRPPRRLRATGSPRSATSPSLRTMRCRAWLSWFPGDA
jgi:hypothetical protein